MSYTFLIVIAALGAVVATLGFVALHFEREAANQS
jgi:hypothetical protein